MNGPAKLKIVAERLQRDRADLRHTILDVTRDLREALANPTAFPEPLRDEVHALWTELDAVQPRFPSHRKTSVLFDEAGLGKPGRDRARHLADRVVAVSRASRD